MKTDQSRHLASRLRQIDEKISLFSSVESREAIVKDLSDMIAELSELRAGLLNLNLQERIVGIQKPLTEVIEFLEFAKSDRLLNALLKPARKAVSLKVKRVPVEIAADLTNDQIRKLLDNNLTRDELQAIASQRAISIGKLNNKEIRIGILKNLNLQEGYERLAGP